MKLLPFSTAGRIYFVTAILLIAAIFVVFFLLFRPSPVATPLDKTPTVLGENTPIRQEPIPETTVPGPQLIKPLDLENVKAKSFLVYDGASGNQLAGYNETFALPIASVTKLMTAYV